LRIELADLRQTIRVSEPIAGTPAIASQRSRESRENISDWRGDARFMSLPGHGILPDDIRVAEGDKLTGGVTAR
jgi:hypothetical protein